MIVPLPFTRAIGAILPALDVNVPALTQSVMFGADASSQPTRPPTLVNPDAEPLPSVS